MQFFSLGAARDRADFDKPVLARASAIDWKKIALRLIFINFSQVRQTLIVMISFIIIGK